MYILKTVTIFIKEIQGLDCDDTVIMSAIQYTNTFIVNVRPVVNSRHETYQLHVHNHFTATNSIFTCCYNFHMYIL